MAQRKIAVTHWGEYAHEELVAGGTIKPGHLVKRSSATACVVHDVEGGVAARNFAVEDAYQGNDVDDSYASGDRVFIWKARRGDIVDAYIKAGEDIAIGDVLISAGDGTLIEEGSEGTAVVVKDRIAIALEAVVLTGTGAVATRIKCEIL